MGRKVDITYKEVGCYMYLSIQYQGVSVGRESTFSHAKHEAEHSSMSWQGYIYIYDIVYGPKIAPNFDNQQQNLKTSI